MFREREWLSIAQNSEFYQQCVFSKNLLKVNLSCHVKDTSYVSCTAWYTILLLLYGAMSVVVDYILIQRLNDKSHLQGNSHTCPLPTDH